MKRILVLACVIVACDGGGVPVDDDDALPDGTTIDLGSEAPDHGIDRGMGGTGGLPDLDAARLDAARPDATPDAALPDRDGDGIPDATDNCAATPNPTQADADTDGLGDACDLGDADGDGLPDRDDTCPLFAGPSPDTDGDTTGDACDVCPQIADPEQTDTDTDGIGDACEIPGDDDADGVPDATDNCPHAANGDQADGDADGVGTLCDICPQAPDPAQLDTDADGLGDGCDVCPQAAAVAENHLDRDGDGQPTCAGDCDDANPERAAGLAERCDDADNDCNLMIDEAFPELGEACTAGIGACHREGRRVCSPAGTACDVSPGIAAPEACNDLDDDCDGLTDEALPGCCDDGEAQPCGTDEGICTRGQQRCAGGTFGACSGVGPGRELCNRLDDDCDGQLDEAFDLQSDSAHCGRCGNACAPDEACIAGTCDRALTDCAALLRGAPDAPSGVYRIAPDPQRPAETLAVYCDMETEGGGWTLCLNARYTEEAAALFTEQYTLMPPADPFGYYDFCPLDADDYLFSLADQREDGFRLHTATLRIHGSRPLVQNGNVARRGVFFDYDESPWITLDPALRTDCEPPGARSPESFDLTDGSRGLIFWEWASPGFFGGGKKRGYFVCDVTGANELDFLVGAGCNYGGCIPDFHVDCWEGSCPNRPANWNSSLISGAGLGFNRGNGFTTLLPADRTQVYFRRPFCEGAGEPCAVGQGACRREGTRVCDRGLLRCDAEPLIEACNGRDDTCDGRTDEGFDLQTDPHHCGGCNRPCGADAACRGGQCVDHPPLDCADLQRRDPNTPSGIQLVQPDPDRPAFDVWCDMDTDGGGWTELARYAFADGPDPFPGRSARDAWAWRQDEALDRVGRGGSYQHDFRKFTTRLTPASPILLAAGDQRIQATGFVQLAEPRPESVHVHQATLQIDEVAYVFWSPCQGGCCDQHTAGWDLPLLISNPVPGGADLFAGINQPAYGWVDVACNTDQVHDTTPAFGATRDSITTFAHDFVIMYR